MDLSELARYVYFGGVKSPRLRPLIWLYLLGHYPPGSGEEDRRILDQECIQQYQKIRAEDEEIKKVSCPSISHFIVKSVCVLKSGFSLVKDFQFAHHSSSD